jgi:hypothetical protein
MIAAFPFSFIPNPPVITIITQESFSRKGFLSDKIIKEQVVKIYNESRKTYDSPRRMLAHSFYPCYSPPGEAWPNWDVGICVGRRATGIPIVTAITAICPILSGGIHGKLNSI